jgi:hypothetical protein
LSQDKNYLYENDLGIVVRKSYDYAYYFFVKSATGRHDIAEILLKVAINTKNLAINQSYTGVQYDFHIR